MMKKIVLLVLVLVAAVLAGTPSSDFVNAKKRALVIVDSLDLQNTHSAFLKQLKDRNYTLKFQQARDPNIQLSSYGDFHFDALIFLSVNTEGNVKKFINYLLDFGGDLNSKSIKEFVEAGHNVFIASSTKLPEPLRDIANDLGVEFDADNTNVIDHFNVAALDAEFGRFHTVVTSSQFNPATSVLGKSFSKKPVAFYGLGMSLDQDNTLLLPILTGSETSYSYNPSSSITEEPHVKGLRTTLVAGVQTKGGKHARVTFVGSLDMLSNKFFESNPANAEFAKELTKWSFQERSFIRHRNVHHYKVGESTTPENYRIAEDLEYTVVLEEWDGTKFVPFEASDVQVEFIMLDPYIRTSLKYANGKHSVQFKTPDVYGVFKFNGTLCICLLTYIFFSRLSPYWLQCSLLFRQCHCETHENQRIRQIYYCCLSLLCQHLLYHDWFCHFHFLVLVHA